MKCGITHPENGRYIPLCRCAISTKSESKTCKDVVRLYVLNLTDNKTYKLDLSGQSLWGVSKEEASPFQNFQAFLRDNKVGPAEVLVDFGVKQVGAAYLMDFSNFAPVDKTDEAFKTRMAFVTTSAQMDFKGISTWEPPEVKARKEKVEGFDDKPNGLAAVESDPDDDINW
jgi:hypothetical protein